MLPTHCPVCEKPLKNDFSDYDKSIIKSCVSYFYPNKHRFIASSFDGTNLSFVILLHNNVNVSWTFSNKKLEVNENILNWFEPNLVDKNIFLENVKRLKKLLVIT